MEGQSVNTKITKDDGRNNDISQDRQVDEQHENFNANGTQRNLQPTIDYNANAPQEYAVERILRHLGKAANMKYDTQHTNTKIRRRRRRSESFRVSQ